MKTGVTEKGSMQRRVTTARKFTKPAPEGARHLRRRAEKLAKQEAKRGPYRRR